MGGGVGLSIYGDHRLATDNSKFAMPETAIGFFPDVGASYFLSNLPNNIGKFIGLTGEVLTLNEIIFFGLATDYFPIENLEKVNSKALVTYTVAGDPNLDTSEKIISEILKGIEKSNFSNFR